MATFLNDEFNGAKNISDKLFNETLNLFVDEFGSLLLAHKNANFFRSYALILKDFIELERAVLSVEAPAKPQGDSVAMAAQDTNYQNQASLGGILSSHLTRV